LYKDDAFFCGGTLISSQHILTAAHCVNGVSASRLRARIGSNTLATYVSDTVSVASVDVHANYSAVPLDNDLAILTLSSPVSNNPITVTSTEAMRQATPAPYSVLGWGDTNPSDSCQDYPNNLQQANLNIVDFPDCKAIYGGSLTDNMICATESYNATTNKDACQGDSGGPLIEDLGGGVYQQVGIVSWGIGCGSLVEPGVYTDVSAPGYGDWINSFVSVATPARVSMVGSLSEKRTALNDACRIVAPKKSGGSLDLFLLFLLIPLGLKRLHL